MGQKNSRRQVYAADTFLTAYDYEEDEVEDEEAPEGVEVSEIDEEKTHLSSVATEDYVPPPNEYFVDTQFDTFKQNHYAIKGKYIKELHRQIVEQIPQSIEEAAVMSSITVKDIGGEEDFARYVIDPIVASEINRRSDAESVKQYRRKIKDTIDVAIAGRNKAMAYRQGGKRALPCTTFMDPKISEFHNSIEYPGNVDSGKRKFRLTERRTNIPDYVEDSSTILEFRKYIRGTKRKAIREELSKATWIERYRRWRQYLREKFVDYSYE